MSRIASIENGLATLDLVEPNSLAMASSSAMVGSLVGVQILHRLGVQDMDATGRPGRAR